MSDLISRQAAIEALCGECQGRCIPCEHYPCGEVKALEQLPSAQPEIIRCKDCEYFLDNTECGYPWCERRGISFVSGFDYCSYAERRNDELR